MRQPKQNTVLNRDLRRFILEETCNKEYNEYILGSNKYRKVMWKFVWEQLTATTEEKIGYCVRVMTYGKEKAKWHYFDLKLIRVKSINDLPTPY